MRKKHNSNMIRRIIDVCMTVLLLFLMAYQVTGEAVHEWIGIAMTVLVITHQVLNRRWYKAIFKGKNNPYRMLTTAVNVLLLLSFTITALSGMSMSGHAVPFLYGMAPASLARQMHLAMSHWSFVLMGLHLGLHVPAMTAGMKMGGRKRLIAAAVFCVISGIGLWMFLGHRMPDYMFFRAAFATLDYDKAGILVFLENLLMLISWAFIGDQAAVLCRKSVQKKSESDKDSAHAADNNNRLLPLVFILSAAIIGLAFNTAFPSVNNGFGSGDRDKHESDKTMSNQNDKATEAAADDGFILVEGGTFMMGSPDSENWRIEDETRHEVTLSSFYIDAYETTQTDYELLMGNNPSTFKGDKLPVENITWIEALQYANARSKEAGLTPAYEIMPYGYSETCTGSRNGRGLVGSLLGRI